jgi:hypothetical protein
MFHVKQVEPVGPSARRARWPVFLLTLNDRIHFLTGKPANRKRANLYLNFKQL